MDPTQYLRDIRGLDPVPWWPLATGWWWLLGALVSLLVLALLLRWWLGRARRDWREEARGELRVLRRRARRDDARLALNETAVLMRRVAMARHGRRACAGLVGEQWLAWLQTNDPVGFPWRRDGRALSDMLYAPPAASIDRDQVLRILDAMQAWTKPQPGERKPWRWFGRLRGLPPARETAHV